MERYAGQELGARPHVAVLFADKLGGFVVATPLLRGLKEKHPGCTLDYFGGERVAELEAACRHVDSRCSLHGPADALGAVAAYAARRRALAGPYDLAVNLDADPLNAAAAGLLAPRYVVGPCRTSDDRDLPYLDDEVDRLHHEFWSSPDLLARYHGVLDSTYIAEIFCRLARVETDYHRTEVPTAPPPLPVPDVLIATGATRRAKLWPTHHWLRLLTALADRGLSLGLLGSPPALQRSSYRSGDADEWLLAATPLVDLRGKLRLPEVAGALARARGCVTVDNGVMHLAYSVGAPTVALFGASPWRVWAPRLEHLAVLLPRESCSLCEENRYRNEGCLRKRQVCLESVEPARVLAELDRRLRPRPATPAAQPRRRAHGVEPRPALSAALPTGARGRG